MSPMLLAHLGWLYHRGRNPEWLPLAPTHQVFSRVALKRKAVKYTRGQLHQVSFWLRLQLTIIYISKYLWNQMYDMHLLISIHWSNPWITGERVIPFTMTTSSGTIGVGFSMNLVSPVPKWATGMVLGWWPENPILFGHFLRTFVGYVRNVTMRMVEFSVQVKNMTWDQSSQ